MDINTTSGHAKTLLENIPSFAVLAQDITDYATRHGVYLPQNAGASYAVLALNFLARDPKNEISAKALLTFILDEENLDTLTTISENRAQRKSARPFASLSPAAGLCHMLNALKEETHV